MKVVSDEQPHGLGIQRNTLQYKIEIATIWGEGAPQFRKQILVKRCYLYPSTLSKLTSDHI